MKAVVDALPIRSKNDIVINGNDIIELGFSGIMIGEILNDIEHRIAECHLENESNAVIDYIRRNYDKNKRVN